MGANMSFRRTAVLEAKGFDEHYKRNALWEEVDLCLRLIEKGDTIWYCADARVTHLREKSGGCRGTGQYAYLYHQFANTAYFAARFARAADYWSWFTFWRYRLEFLSRREKHAQGKRLRHDPWAVAAGAAGALGGIARFIGARLFSRKRIGKVDKELVAKAVTQ